MIKVTFEADYDYEILNFIGSLARLESKTELCGQTYDNCSLAGTEHDLCDSPTATRRPDKPDNDLISEYEKLNTEPTKYCFCKRKGI